MSYYDTNGGRFSRCDSNNLHIDIYEYICYVQRGGIGEQDVTGAVLGAALLMTIVFKTIVLGGAMVRVL